MRWSTFAALAVAGAVGAVARVVLDGWVGARSRALFPWATFVINVSGSLLLGLVTGAALYHGLPASPRIWLGTGFCGAYTTFSTFTFEVVGLADGNQPATALRYAGASLVLGTAAAALGLALAGLL